MTLYNRPDKIELEFIDSCERALIEQSPRHSRAIIICVTLFFISLLIWAYYAEIDQVTRGTGRVIPSGKIQSVQNLEGGIVEEILVRAGDEVKAGQPLIKIKNQGFESVFHASQGTIDGLKIEISRLESELEQTPFKIPSGLSKKNPDIARVQQGIYKGNIHFLDSQMKMLTEQINQKKARINTTKISISYLKKKEALIQKKIAIVTPLVERKIESESDFIDLKQQEADLGEKIDMAGSAIIELKSEIAAMEQKKKEVNISFRARARKELNEAIKNLSSLEEKQKAFKDQVSRTLVTAPSRGIVKIVYVNTVGQVVKPGMDLVDIVPIEESLLIEDRVKPSDIAFIHPGQKATVKVTAYDFSIYGGLKGEVVRISADTLKDERNQTYFLVEVKTEKTNLGTRERPLKIIPGMTVTVDIITGKKTILNYLLKPILRAKQNALTES